MKFSGLTHGARRIALPLGLIGAGLWMLVGCIYIPTFNMTTGAKDATKSVGDAHSDKRLRPGVSTRRNVRKLLGKPFFATADGRFLVYSWKKQKGLLIYPQCFMVLPETDAFAMTLEFGADGVMSGFDVERQPGMASLFSVPNAKRFVPYHVTLHQMELNLQGQPEMLQQFRAATRSIRTTTRPSMRYK